MKVNITDNVGGRETTPAGNQPVQPRRRSIAPSIAKRLAERQGPLPVWIRCPVSGPEFYSGQTRAKLYELAGKGLIRSASLREPGQVKGVRVFHLQSVLDYIESNEIESTQEAA